MSVTASNYEEINRSPTNKSTAKQLYSFPKSSRFTVINKNLNQVVSYDLPSTKSNRTTSFGYGKRGIFVNKVTGPPPGSYEPLSQFASRTPTNKGFSFGISRDAYSKVYNEKDKKPDKAVPGPGTYQTDERCGKEGLRYTLKPRISSNLLKYTTSMPGPGTYDSTPALDLKGTYYNSKFRNSRASVFSPARSKRFSNYSRNSTKNLPGPGTYNSTATISKDGNYFLSKFKSSMCRTFYHYNRDTMSRSDKRSQLPGPGMYRLPSEFGYYEPKKASKDIVIKKGKRRARSVEEPKRAKKLATKKS